MKKVDSVVTTLGPGGRIVIPAEFRKRMDACEGARLVLILRNRRLTVMTQEEGVRLAHELMEDARHPSASCPKN